MANNTIIILHYSDNNNIFNIVIRISAQAYLKNSAKGVFYPKCTTGGNRGNHEEVMRVNNNR